MRNKLFSIINIGGLSVGIASCVLIFLYVQDELSYDKHWKYADRIVKVNWEESTDGVPNPYSETAFVAGPSWKENLPEVESFTRILFRNNFTVNYEDKYFSEDNNYVVDSNFLEFFDFDLEFGDPGTCLEEPNSVVVSKALALKFFGNADPLGKVLIFPAGPYKITGILKNTHKKSHLKPNTLLRINYDNEQMSYRNVMTWLQTYTYVKLKNVADVKNFDNKLAQWNKKIVAPILKDANIGYGVKLISEPVSDVHFDTYFKDYFDRRTDKNYVFIFALVALFLLLIACFNFINLSTARASKRLKEVGVRKASGATRKNLILQFLGESFLISSLSLAIGIVLLVLTTPAFNSFTSKDLHFVALFTGSAFWVLVSILIFISFVGGIYPAFYLSGFNPVYVLKGVQPDLKKASGFRRISLRQLLVVMQFTISAAVIICTILVYDQLKMMKNKELGFDKEQVLEFRFPKLDSLTKIKANAFKNKILSHSTIKGVATARQLFGAAGNTLFRVKGKDQRAQASLNVGNIDYNYLQLMDIKLIQGRSFSQDYGTDKYNFVLNESAVRLLNLREPLGTELTWDDENWGKVIGVVKDYNYESPHKKIEPICFRYSEVGAIAFVKLYPQNISKGIDAVKQEWKELFPHNQLSYFFLDEKFNEEYYRGEDIMMVLLTCFSALTILISCLGLLGLAAFVTEQRKKEIAIRKVVGASVSNIVYQVSKDFLLLVIIAGVIASPIAYYFIHDWLQNFAYRINISFWIFIGTALATLIIAFLTMSGRTISAANSNPVKSLRVE